MLISEMCFYGFLFVLFLVLMLFVSLDFLHNIYYFYHQPKHFILKGEGLHFYSGPTAYLFIYLAI
jgi:hypothetical protein